MPPSILKSTDRDRREAPEHSSDQIQDTFGLESASRRQHFQPRAALAVSLVTNHSKGANRRLLVIDDNPAIHEDMRKILGPGLVNSAQVTESAAAVFGDAADTSAALPVFQVDCASQGQEGVSMVRQARDQDQSYAVAFVDARMPPGWDGLETITRLWEQDPDVLIVLCTAYADFSWQEIRTRLARPERLVILKKPFDNMEVLQLADGLTEKWRLARSEQRHLQELQRRISERNREHLTAPGSEAQLTAGNQSPAAAPAGSGNGMDSAAQRRRALERALHDALRDNQFTLHYQPLVDIVSRRVVSLEALLRWRHPEFGAVSPAEFIPIIEENGLIMPIGEFVLRSVCQQVVRWERAGVPVVPVAVNVSGVQLERLKTLECIGSILREEGMQPQRLALELTESTLMKSVQRHSAELQRLRADGVSIEMDDFGTGYSSLSNLRHLPLDVIKIDRSFITRLDTHKTDEAIVGAILTMTHSLGMRAVAEGVEKAQQLAVLARLGCDTAQGFYFSRPLPAEECRHLLTEWAARPSFTDTLRLLKPDLNTDASSSRAGNLPAPRPCTA
jgi:EAL domain-containing protein (putative c-di-GMP-specific phosphodiesterase class I)/DNA-binding NarL/FixJ family response regulator